jgi:hypothetical protein
MIEQKIASSPVCRWRALNLTNLGSIFSNHLELAENAAFLVLVVRFGAGDGAFQPQVQSRLLRQRPMVIKVSRWK